MQNENGYIHLFNLWRTVSWRKLRLLKTYFGGFERAWRFGQISEYIKIGFDADDVAELSMLQKKVSHESEMSGLEKLGVRMVGLSDPEYPFLLKQIAFPPWLIYCRGASLKSNREDVAIVGTRVPSVYGREYAERISEIVVEGGGRIVSGLAFGVDSCAHRISVGHNAPTVAVLASSVCSITPRSNTVLAERIIETGGTIVSEYAGAGDSFKYRFRERNRIIAGMCRATIVVEAGEKSGALITAHHAFEQNREVFALCCDINRPNFRGCLDLIGKDVAHPITDLERLASDLQLKPDPPSLFDESGSGQIKGLLKKNRWTDLQTLLNESGCDAGKINSTMSILEINGSVKSGVDGWKLV